MGTFRLILATPRQSDAPRLIAEHMDPVWLKQRGYEIARSLGDATAVWSQRLEDTRPRLALRCRTGHALAILPS